MERAGGVMVANAFLGVGACALIILLLFANALALGAQPDEATQALLDAMRFDDKTGRPFVDLDAARRALNAGANPNYAPRPNSSVLTHLSFLCEEDFSKAPETSRLILEAFRLLFDRGARLQNADR